MLLTSKYEVISNLSDDMCVKGRGFWEKEDRSERSSEEQGDTTPTSKPSGNRGVREKWPAFEKTAGETVLSGAIHISVIVRR